MPRVQRLPLLVLVTLQLFFAMEPAFGSQSGDPTTSDVLDAFWLMENFAAAVAARDTNTDPMFKCLVSTRLNLDPSVPSAAYRWSLNVDGDEQKKNPLVEFTPGPAPDQLYAVVNGDTSHPTISRFLYTDYKTCAIEESHLLGNQCTLWVLPELKDSVPQQCLEKYTDMCGEGVSLYDKDLCG